MANFSTGFLDEVLARTDLVQLVARHVELKRAGSNFMGLCPFHHEKSPSFSVSPDKQLYYCFGCGKGGGAFQFLMEHDGYAFPEAVELLAEKVGLEVPREFSGARENAQQRIRDFNVLESVTSYFVQRLKSDEGVVARRYLEQRGLPAEIVEVYQLGYAPSGYGVLAKHFARVQDVESKLEAVGLLFKGERGYGDYFRHRLMFPIKDRRGHVVGFGGRILDEGQPKYLNTPETELFRKSNLLYGLSEHRDAIRDQKMVLVVEGYMDVLGLAAHGFPIAVAPLGTAISEIQIRDLFRLCSQPVFCFDGDKAGRQAAWRALERMLPLLQSDIEPKFLYLPEGEDPDSLVRKEGEAFRLRLQQESKPVLDTWLLGLQNMVSQGAHGGAQMAKKADQMLQTMQDHFLRQAWQKAVESKTGIRLHQAVRQMQAPRMGRGGEGGAIKPLFSFFLTALLQKTDRLLKMQLSDDKLIFLDYGHAYHVYTRALELKQQIDGDAIGDEQLIRELMLSFPDDTNISRWVNHREEITDDDFEGLLNAVRAQAIGEWLARNKALPLEEIMRLKRKMIALNEQRKYRGEI
ncbi:MAG: DNA primase [Zetaproteobacteria bacterium]|nr:DNA primase [Zetaproteobacteria bacterium]